MFAKALKSLAFAAVAALVSLAAPLSANAATQTTTFYVATMGDGLGIYSTTGVVTDSTPSTAHAVTEDSVFKHTYRSLAADSSHLYFADNNRDGVWDLVRTDFTGGNREVVAANIAAPESIQVMGVSVYYTTWTGGLFWVPAGGGTPTPILGPTNDAGLGGSVPTTGYGPFSLSGGKLYIDINAVGLVQADWSFNNPTNAQIVTPAGYVALNVTDLVTVDGTVYVGSWNGTGYYTTTDLSTAVSSWTHHNTSFPSPNTWTVYRIAVSGNNLHYTTSLGDLYGFRDGSNGITINNLVETPANTSDFGLVIVEMPVAENTSEPLANTGSDLNLLWAGLGLLAVGSFLTFRRKN